jgi:hypothetical protein
VKEGQVKGRTMRNPFAGAFEAFGKSNRDNYAIVGELVRISNSLDYVLTEVLIDVLDLKEGAAGGRSRSRSYCLRRRRGARREPGACALN